MTYPLVEVDGVLAGDDLVDGGLAGLLLRRHLDCREGGEYHCKPAIELEGATEKSNGGRLTGDGGGSGSSVVVEDDQGVRLKAAHFVTRSPSHSSKRAAKKILCGIQRGQAVGSSLVEPINSVDEDPHD